MPHKTPALQSNARDVPTVAERTRPSAPGVSPSALPPSVTVQLLGKKAGAGDEKGLPCWSGCWASSRK